MIFSFRFWIYKVSHEYSSTGGPNSAEFGAVVDITPSIEAEEEWSFIYANETSVRIKPIDIYTFFVELCRNVYINFIIKFDCTPADTDTPLLGPAMKA